LYTLGWIYYDQAVDESQEGYLGIPPTQPQPDFSKFLQIYQLLMEEYPDVLPRVSLRMATFYIASGKPDSAKIILEQSLEQFPHSPFISRIHFRLADIAFTEGRFSQSYDHLQEIRKNQIDSASWERAHYRRGECMYRLGNFDTAIRYFHTFVIECDARRYRRTLGLRCEAVKFIASAFSNMPDGARRWNDFSQENRDRPHISEIEARLRF
jgi:tetratricopeptide (TPR) repeat protein